MKLTTAIIAASFALAPVAASAATLSVIGGTADNLDALYDPSPATPGIGNGDNIKTFSGSFAGNGLSVSSDALVTFTFLGKEAAAINTAMEAGGQTLSNTDAAGTSMTATFTAGLIDFSFATNLSGGSSIQNGVGSTNGNLSLAFSDVVGNNKVYAFFGDGIGDVDHDDMVLEISVAAIPLPAGMLLLGTALGGLAIARRRK